MKHKPTLSPQINLSLQNKLTILVLGGFCLAVMALSVMHSAIPPVETLPSDQTGIPVGSSGIVVPMDRTMDTLPAAQELRELDP